MQELRGNLWDLARNSILCITTNGFVKKSGECVMGRGIALAAAKKFPVIPKLLGDGIKLNGNVVQSLGLFAPYLIVSFPVKPAYSLYANNVVKHMKNKFASGDTIPGWACLADLHIIQKSVEQLLKLTEDMPVPIYLPRPGCGAGELTWEQVKPLMEVLPDNYFVCTF